MGGHTLLQKWRLLQAALSDPDLSPAAKLVLARLLDHHNVDTGQCSPSFETLARGASITRRTAQKGMRELRDAGWVDRRHATRQGSDGHLSNSYELRFDRAGPVEEVASERTPDGVQTDTTPGVETDATLAAKRTPGVASKRTPKHGKREHGKGTQVDSPQPPTRFDEFWAAYPRKVGKDAARKSFERIVRSGRATEAELIAGAARYAAEKAGDDPQFTKHPTTWLNGGHWSDEPAQPRSRSTNGRGAYSALDRLMERMPDDE